MVFLLVLFLEGTNVLETLDNDCVAASDFFVKVNRDHQGLIAHDDQEDCCSSKENV